MKENSEAVLPVAKSLQLKVQSIASLWRSARSRRYRQLAISAFYYIVVISLSFVFLYPLLFIVSHAMMQPADLADQSVLWIPKTFDFTNYIVAHEAMRFNISFKNSVMISVGSGILQVIGCSLAAYGFARYRFPGYTILMALLLAAFLVPPQSMIVPLYLLYSQLDWMNTPLPIMVPSLLGHGLRGALFVLVFIQFFRGLPTQLEESARIDGAGPYRTFISIIMPLAGSAILVVFLFSLVWHWNDLFEPNLYLNTATYQTLSQFLTQINPNNLNSNPILGDMGNDTMGGVPAAGPRLMAGAMLCIAPILVLYLFAQRYFVEGIERTGIVGE